MAMAEPTHEQVVDLRNKVDQYFNETELRNLCFELQVEYGSLEGEDKPAKVLSLVQQCRRTSTLRELAKLCAKYRPKVEWPLAGGATISFTNPRPSFTTPKPEGTTTRPLGSTISNPEPRGGRIPAELNPDRSQTGHPGRPARLPLSRRPTPASPAATLASALEPYTVLLTSVAETYDALVHLEHFLTSAHREMGARSDDHERIQVLQTVLGCQTGNFPEAIIKRLTRSLKPPVAPPAETSPPGGATAGQVLAPMEELAELREAIDACVQTLEQGCSGETKAEVDEPVVGPENGSKMPAPVSALLRVAAAVELPPDTHKGLLREIHRELRTLETQLGDSHAAAHATLKAIGETIKQAISRYTAKHPYTRRRE